MNLEAIHSLVRPTTPPPLERLAHCESLSEEQKVAEASRLFEALLLRQILRETQQPVIHSTFEGESASSAIYRDLFCEHLADAIARSGALGLAQTLQSQLTPQPRGSHSTSSGTAPPGTDTVLPPTPPAGLDPSPGPARPPVPARGAQALWQT
ncbi:MAG: hypothetical protein KatS3mg132_840 [Limisphaera sp.]|nr:MAG: hypothetical protein KatS3mg132_840 [Limisphaera sp.]